MSAPASLDERIAALSESVDEQLRRELQQALATLRNADDAPGAIMDVSRLIEGQRGLLGCIASARNYKLKGYNLDAQIEELAQKGILPAEIASDFHWIRIRANKARHNIEKITLSANDAEMALDRALSIVEWFYTKWEHGPRLPAIYSAEFRRVTLQERFEELQDATIEQARSLQSEIALLHETLRRAGQRGQEISRDPIPIPLPRLRGTFVDRETERDTLHHLLRQGDMRLVVIVAPGGYGKTELTSKILKEVAPGSSIIDPDVKGILYLRCVSGDLSLGRVFSEAGRIVGGREAFEQTYANRDLTLKRKLEFFFSELSRAGNVWLVMDNFEDLLSTDDQIVDRELREFIETAVATEHNIRLIATTRAVPRFAGSQRVKPVDLRSGLPEDRAIEYLQAEGIDCGLADADQQLLRAFVGRVHHIPKALESVIGYLSEKYPVVQLADLMANDALFADFDRYDTENGLKRLIAEQFSDQTADAQLVLCALSIFPKPAPLAALRYLLPALDWATVLPRLERNRLISRQGDRYDLHPLVREYAYSRIPSQAERARADYVTSELEVAQSGGTAFTRSALHGRAAMFYAELRVPREQWKTITDIDPQLDEFYHLTRAGQFELAARSLDVIDFDFLQLWGHYRAVIEMREGLVGKLTDPFSEQSNLCGLGICYGMTGEVRRSISFYERALEISQRENFRSASARALGCLGNAYSHTGEIDRAVSHYRQALQITRERGDRRAEAITLSNLGTTSAVLGDMAEAIDYYEQALLIDRSLGDRRFEAITLGNLGSAYAALGYLPQAIDYHEQALQVTREVRDRREEGTQLGNLAACCTVMGETAKAVAYCQESLAVAREIGDRDGEGFTIAVLGDAAALEEDFERAVTHYEQALRVAREIGHKAGVSRRLLGLGSAYHHRGDLRSARACYEEALGFDVAETNYACAVKLGVAHLGEGNRGEAARFFTEGIALCRARTQRAPRYYSALYKLALAELGTHETERALATYRRAVEACSAAGALKSALLDLRLLERASPDAEIAICECAQILSGIDSR
jgi:tetratricopeptide (TPR) repeat protein